MARKAEGQIVERTGSDGLIYRSLRFRAYGKRRFNSLGAVTRAEAERELRHVLADVERGIWQPRQAVVPERPELPTFHQFAEDWWLLHEQRLAASTQVEYRWRLERHLLPRFRDHRLDEITVDAVDRYVAVKLAEPKPLSPRSINMTVWLLGAILESAVDRELIARNPARGRGRKVRESSPRRSYLETAEQIEALLEAAGELDRSARARYRHVQRRGILATLLFAGLRIGELCALRWRDVDLASGWLHVGKAKTDAGRRAIKIRGALHDTFVAIRPVDADPDASVFATSTGQPPSAENIRNRTLAAAVALASERLLDSGRAPLPERVTPHSLRRTFCSVLYALGEDPGTVMDEMGHTHPGLALRVYRQAMRRGDDERVALRALVEGSQPSPVAARRARPRRRASQHRTRAR